MVGFGKACEIAENEMEKDEKNIKKLYQKILDRVRKMDHIELNGD